MKIEHTEVYGFRAALRGMRNPMDSWEKSDSEYHLGEGEDPYFHGTDLAYEGFYGPILVPEGPVIGPNDMELALKLIRNRPEHRKFMRQIMVWFDITIPRFAWTELDTYKVATVRNSCSTMHKLGTRDLTQEDFELPISQVVLDILNTHGVEFRQAKLIEDKVERTAARNKIREEYKNDLPEGYLQKATFMMSYETARSMYFQRKMHRLPQWRAGTPGSVCEWLASLPYMKQFIEA